VCSSDLCGWPLPSEGLIQPEGERERERE